MLRENFTSKLLDVATITITPQTAQEWLNATETRNRMLTKNRIEKYAGIMKAGKWKLNGETIIFDNAGNLLNGQHRLTACVRADAPFVSLVVRGVEYESFDTLDQGKNRALPDILSIRGHYDTACAAGAIRFVRALDLGMSSAKQRVTDQVLADYHGTLKGFQLWLVTVPNKDRVFPRTMLMAFGYWASRKTNPELVREFIDRMIHGYDLKRTHPILKLRNRVISLKLRTLTQGQRDNLFEQILRVWNALDGTHYDPNDKAPLEPFTQPKPYKTIKWQM